MKAIAVRPGTPNSVHERDIPMPSIDKIPDGKGILVKVLKVGVDATDREINDALYGNPPPGDDYLVLGHESFGIVKEVGANVRNIKVGDYVTATVRRPGGSIYDKIGTYDMTSEETYYERGINLLHVPYKGSGPATTALMANEIQVLLVGIATVLPQMTAGRLKVLGVTTTTRSSAAPEIPTVAEAGLPGFDFGVWYGLVAPAATPKPVLARLHREVFALMEQPALRERFSGAGLEPLRGSVEEFAASMQRELARWREVVKTADIRAD